jgi:hypothetical protein
MSVGSSLSLIFSNFFMKDFEKPVLDTEQYKPSLWFRYVDDIFVVWPHGPERLQKFRSHLNSSRPSIRFTMEIESENEIYFLDVLVIRKWKPLATKVYRKPTHTVRYLSFKYNYPLYVKICLL